MEPVLIRGGLPVVLLLLPACTAQVESGLTSKDPLPKLVAQRVSATVQREAFRFVRLSTEREDLLTTPEHPFATPGSGWVSAGRLAPDDWVVSERLGAVQLLSVRSEVAARPVRVFNLSVVPSHAYLVGTDRVLVHNTKCKFRSPEDRERAIELALRQREEIEREMAVLAQTAPAPPRIAELRAAIKKLTERIKTLRFAQRRALGLAIQNKAERSRLRYEADHEATRKTLEDAKRELAELESREPRFAAKKAAVLARKVVLAREIRALQLSHERTERILNLQRKLAELETDTSALGADRVLEERRKLRADLEQEQKRERDAQHKRKKRADPEERAARAEYERKLKLRLVRHPSHLADTERPRDPLELLEAELARQLQEAPSERRDARVHHVTEQIETMKRLAVVRRSSELLRQRVRLVRLARERWIRKGVDTSEFDKKLERPEADLRALRIETAQLRVRERQLRERERLLDGLDATPWAEAPGSVDEARLREFERQLAEGLEDEQALGGIERALDAMDPARADWEAVLAEADDVDALLSEREDLMRQGASPERAVRFESSYERLEHELREERVAVEAAVSALMNESAHIQTTRASSSSGASWQERLKGIGEEQERLVARWRTGLRARVDSARRQLELLRSVQAFRDEDIEAELVREIALIERELQRAG